MHYYKRNLGDYAKKCGRLSMLEHGAYTLLIDACYDREQFPTMAEAIDWCWARSESEIDAVKFVLIKFFSLEGEVYVQNRIKEELDDYHNKAVKNKVIATEREEKRRAIARIVHEPLPKQHESSPNQEPRTKNQEPINQLEKNSKRNFHEVQRLNEVDPKLWTQFEKFRSKKKAPISDAVITGLRRKSEEAGLTLVQGIEHWLLQGSTGFFPPVPRQGAPQAASFRSQDAARAKADMDFLKQRDRELSERIDRPGRAAIEQ